MHDVIRSWHQNLRARNVILFLFLFSSCSFFGRILDPCDPLLWPIELKFIDNISKSCIHLLRKVDQNRLVNSPFKGNFSVFLTIFWSLWPWPLTDIAQYRTWSSFCHSTPPHQVSSKSVEHFSSYLVYRHTDTQTYRHTDTHTDGQLKWKHYLRSTLWGR